MLLRIQVGRIRVGDPSDRRVGSHAAGTNGTNIEMEFVWNFSAVGSRSNIRNPGAEFFIGRMKGCCTV